MQFRTLVTLTLFAMAAAASPTMKPDTKVDKATDTKPSKKPKPAKPLTKKPVATKGPAKKE
jgi:hypothetical protein